MDIYSGAAPIKVAWSFDGTRIAATEINGGLRVCYADTGKSIFTARAHDGYFSAVAWSLDGKYVVTGTSPRPIVMQKLGNVRFVEVWDATTGKEISHMGPYSRALWVTFSPDSTRVAASTSKIIEDPALLSVEQVEVWNIVTRNSIFRYNVQSDRAALAWSPNGQYIASKGDDKTVQLRDATTGTCIFTYDRHSSPVTSVVWSPDGARIASAGINGAVQVWLAASPH